MDTVLSLSIGMPSANVPYTLALLEKIKVLISNSSSSVMKSTRPLMLFW